MEAIPASWLLNAAVASLQLIFNAIVLVKSNKARCLGLLERCRMVVGRVQQLLKQREHDVDADKISALQRAFEEVASTITLVGTQSWIKSLIHSDRDNVAIEQAHQRISDLFTLFNLNELVEVRQNQEDDERARRKDHKEILRLGKQLKLNNDAVVKELAAQGANVAEVLELVRELSRDLRKEPESGNRLASSSRGSTPPISGAKAQRNRSSADNTIALIGPPRIHSWAGPSNSSPPQRQKLPRSITYQPESANGYRELVPVHQDPRLPSTSQPQPRPKPPPNLNASLPPTPISERTVVYDENERGKGSSFTQASTEAVRAPDSPTPTNVFLTSHVGDWRSIHSQRSDSTKVLRKSKDAKGKIAQAPNERNAEDVDVRLYRGASLDKGVTLDDFDRIGGVPLPMLNEWLKGPLLGCQALQFRKSALFICLPPSIDPYSVLEKYPTSNSRPTQSVPPSMSKTRTVYVARSTRAFTIVAIRKGSGSIWAAFPWTAATSIRTVKFQITSLAWKAEKELRQCKILNENDGQELQDGMTVGDYQSRHGGGSLRIEVR